MAGDDHATCIVPGLYHDTGDGRVIVSGAANPLKLTSEGYLRNNHGEGRGANEGRRAIVQWAMAEKEIGVNDECSQMAPILWTKEVIRIHSLIEVITLANGMSLKSLRRMKEFVKKLCAF